MALTRLTRWFGARLPGPAARLDKYLRWWLNGLQHAIPKRLQPRPARQYVLEIAKGHAQLYYEANETRQRLGSYGSDDEALPKLLQTSYEGEKNRIIIRLVDCDVLIRRTSLPSAVAANLQQVLAYEMDRITPFHTDQVYFDYRLVERPTEQSRLLVDLAVAPREWIDPWLELLARRGLQAAAIEGKGLWAGGNLLPPALRAAKGGQGERHLNWLLAALVAGLAVAALAGPLVQRDREVRMLEERVTAARGQSAVVVELRSRLAQQERLINFVARQRAAQWPLVEVLREITRLLPDHTWAQQLDVTGDLLEVRGESAQATALIELLESSPMFHAVGFRSPIVGVPNRGVERFHIRMKITPRTLE